MGVGELRIFFQISYKLKYFHGSYYEGVMEVSGD